MKIFYEDNHIIVAYKDSGILSQEDSTGKPDMLTLLKQYIKEKYNKPGNVYLGLVHRLDLNTSGIMVFARTSKAANRLSNQILNKEFEKKYLALVEGKLTNKDYIMLNNKLSKDEVNYKAYVSIDGKDSSLEYKVLTNYKVNNKLCSLLDIKLHTGRFHQIRCQMSNIGYPIFGDKKYGSTEFVDKLDFPLQAYSLSFNHPITKERFIFTYVNDTKYIKYNK